MTDALTASAVGAFRRVRARSWAVDLSITCHITGEKTVQSGMPQAEQLALLPEPEPPSKPHPPTYWENRGPRDWQPVTVATRYGKCSGVAESPFPLIRTGRLGPRNVQIRRADGTSDVVPVRNLRRKDPR